MFIRCMQTDHINFMKFCRHITVLSQMSTYFWDRPRMPYIKKAKYKTERNVSEFVKQFMIRYFHSYDALTCICVRVYCKQLKKVVQGKNQTVMCLRFFFQFYVNLACVTLYFHLKFHCTDSMLQVHFYQIKPPHHCFMKDHVFVHFRLCPSNTEKRNEV